MMCVRDWVPFG